MVPKLFGSGKSFKKLAAYLLHDADNAKTQERIAWTHTMNLASDAPGLAVDEMLWTYRAADDLKREAGIRLGGRPLENPVKHFSLNWHPSEAPSREHMIETVEKFLDHMKWSEHQALIVSHTDKQPHVHVMLNAVHPETGKALDTSFEKRRAQEWALAYEREQGLIFCDERLKSIAERTSSPTRATWQQLRAYERRDDQDHQRSSGSFDYVKDGKGNDAKEWELLKAHQRGQREQFFAEGKEAYRQCRKDAAREVRSSYAAEWQSYYSDKRSGRNGEELAAIKADILEKQGHAIQMECEIACQQLREERDKFYAGLKEDHREQRHELAERQEQGLRSYDLLDRMYPAEAKPDQDARQNDKAERLSEIEHRGFPEADTPEKDDPERESTETPERHRVRDPVDSLGGLGLGAIGALATLGERLFDGFLGGGETRKPAPKAAVRDSGHADDKAVRSAALADAERAARAEEQAKAEAWWRDRSRRWRGRD